MECYIILLQECKKLYRLHALYYLQLDYSCWEKLKHLFPTCKPHSKKEFRCRIWRSYLKSAVILLKKKIWDLTPIQFENRTTYSFINNKKKKPYLVVYLCEMNFIIGKRKYLDWNLLITFFWFLCPFPISCPTIIFFK